MFSLVTISSCFVHPAVAQNLTTKGVEFWAAYGAHANMYNADGSVRADGGSQKMVFYFLSGKATTVTVEIPAINWIRKYNVKGGKTTESEEMPKVGSNDVRLLTEGVSNKGIHITSEDRISVYCHIYDVASSATTLLIPVNISGQEYYSLNYTQHSDNPQGRSYCFIIATEDNTDVEIIPSANTINHTEGVPFTQKLNKGDVLNLFGTELGKQNNNYTGTDLTGTFIHTVNQPQNDACKRIIVFSGSSSVNIMCRDGVSNTSDNLIQQTPPLDAWGRYFVTVPTLKMPVNKYRAVVLKPEQKVYVNGRQLTGLQHQRYYDFQTNKIASVSSDSSILLAQYISSSGQCGNKQSDINTGDPEAIFLTPAGNGLTSAIIHSPRHSNITSHYVNVVIKAGDIDSFTLDGETIPEKFTVFDRNIKYATAQIELSPGRHLLQADSGFSAYAYGYGKFESYGYNAGFSTKYISAEFGVSNPYIMDPTTTTCTATQFRFYFDFEAKLINLQCGFNHNPRLHPNQDVWLTEINPDSSYFKDNVLYYRYYLPGFYQYDVAKQLPLEITAYFPDAKGCIIKKKFNFAATVITKPIASLSLPYDKCANDTLLFTDKSVSFGNSSLVRWIWNFNDGDTSAEKNPQHRFKNFGEYNLQLRTINDIGCYDDTALQIGLYHKPVAAFEITGNLCTKENLLFNSTTALEDDVISQLNWSFNDGRTSSLKNFTKQFTDSGNYEVKLAAKSMHGCTDTLAKAIHIYQMPEINLPPVLYIVSGDTLRLRPSYKGSIKSYNWTPAIYLTTSTSPYPLATPAADIVYNISTLSEGTCTASASTAIKLQKKLDIPNAFSPNGDGVNDVWHIKNAENYAACTVEVFNRWGARMFYSKGYTADWNGAFNGRPLPEGTYYYIINTNSVLRNSVLSGSITILR